MNKKMVQKALRLTQESLARYWQLDPEFVLRLCDEDVLWIGSVQSQFMEGFAATAWDFRDNMRELKPCHLMQQEFLVVQNAGNACTIAGRYLVTTDESVEYFLQVQQRCAFTWELTDGDLKIRMIYVSNPMGELKLAEGEKFPNAMGKMARHYWETHFTSQRSEKRLIVTDQEERTHFLSWPEIVYAAANGRGSLIYTVDGQEIQARMGISKFSEKVEWPFLAVHRSYCINSQYISSIRRYEIVMTDGSRIPVPAKKYMAVREKLMGMFETDTKEEENSVDLP